MSSSESSKGNKSFPRKREWNSSGPPPKTTEFDQSWKKKRQNNAGGKPHFESHKEKWAKRDAKFHYGNYDRYYGKRAIHEGLAKDVKDDAGNYAFDDPRLQFFKKEWFEKKKVLDIGCNVGFVTMAIAHRFAPSSIVGLDIDKKLIQTAFNILRKTFGSASNKCGEKSGTNDKSEVEKTGETKAEERTSWANAKMENLTEMEKAAVSKRVRFESGNYVLASDELLDLVQPEYDAILALSLTKWIHLNWGDDGMKRFFRRVYRHLHPGGIFLMEPQPWSTYKKRRALTPQIEHNYNNTKFKPDQFRSFLLSPEVGFESFEVVNQLEIESEKKGFTRPIFLFRKPLAEATPSPATATVSAQDDVDHGGETSKNGTSNDGTPANESVVQIEDDDDDVTPI